MNLPDAEQLFSRLVQLVQPVVTPQVAIAGVRTGGAWLAERLGAALGQGNPVGLLDPAFHRDDYRTGGLHPGVQPSRMPFSLEGADVLLVDDVLNTGRTVRAALNELFDYGRPARVRLAVLVDRGGRQLPVQPDFSAASLVLPEDQTLALVRDAHGRLSLQLEEGR